MKMAPVSADLIIKIVLGAVVIGAAVYALKKLKDGVSDTIDSIKEKADSLKEKAGEVLDVVVAGTNPTNPNNVVNTGVTAAGVAVTGNPNWTLGGAWWDFTHTDPMKIINTKTDPAVEERPNLIDFGQVSG